MPFGYVATISKPTLIAVASARSETPASPPAFTRRRREIDARRTTTDLVLLGCIGSCSSDASGERVRHSGFPCWSTSQLPLAKVAVRLPFPSKPQEPSATQTRQAIYFAPQRRFHRGYEGIEEIRTWLGEGHVSGGSSVYQACSSPITRPFRIHRRSSPTTCALCTTSALTGTGPFGRLTAGAESGISRSIIVDAFRTTRADLA